MQSIIPNIHNVRKKDCRVYHILWLTGTCFGPKLDKNWYLRKEDGQILL